MATVSMELLVFEGRRFLDLLKTYFGEVQIPVAVFWIGETNIIPSKDALDGTK